MRERFQLTVIPLSFHSRASKSASSTISLCWPYSVRALVDLVGLQAQTPKHNSRAQSTWCNRHPHGYTMNAQKSGVHRTPSVYWPRVVTHNVKALSILSAKAHRPANNLRSMSFTSSDSCTTCGIGYIHSVNDIHGQHTLKYVNTKHCGCTINILRQVHSQDITKK